MSPGECVDVRAFNRKDAKGAKKFGSSPGECTQSSEISLLTIALMMSVFTVVFLTDRQRQREVVFLRSKRASGIRRN